MSKRNLVWHFAATILLLVGVAHAEPPAIVVGDTPITIHQTMQADATIAEISFVDRIHGWAVGDRGVIWHTADGGKTWQLQPSGVTCRLSTVHFLDAKHGWAAGGSTQPFSHASRGVLLTTIDGGATWTEIPQSTLPAITRIKCFDAEHGIAAGDSNSLFPSGVMSTRDGGHTWQPLPTDAGGQWLAADFPDVETGAVIGSAGRFATLMRGRVVASPSAESSVRAYRAVRLAPPTDGWLVGDGGLVLTTHDLGSSWEPPPGELPHYVRESFDFHVVAVVGSHIWIAGSPGTRVFHSCDGGHSWQPQPTGQHAPLRTITFVDSSLGFAAGDLGTILATSDGGGTWQLQRQGGRRAALMTVVARETDVPLEFVAKLGVEDAYLAAVNVLHPTTNAADARTREAMLLAGATATDLAWQFPLPPDIAAATPEELLNQLNRATDGRAVQLLNRYMVRELRMWRPDVVVTHPAEPYFSDPLASLVEQLVMYAVEVAADPNQFPDLATDVGLEAWQVKRVCGLLPPGSQGDVRIATGQFAPRLGATLADWAEPSRRLLYSESQTPPDMVELQLLTDRSDADSSRDLFAGIRLVPGGEARRRLANVPGEDLEELRRLALRRRQMRVLIERTQGNAAWAGQVANLTDGLDPASAGELLFDLAESYRAAGRLDLAADAYSTLARRWPEHPLVEPALTWLVQFYASNETAQRLADRSATNYRPSNRAVQQASAENVPVIGLSRDDRLRRAAALGEYLETARPAMYAEPRIRFPLVAAQRQLGFANPAQRYYLALRALPDNDPWRRCGATEEWFVKSDGLPPPKTLGTCRRASERPHLDGKLDESFWSTADRLRLRGKSSNGTEFRLACGGEFLYLALECPKAQAVDYAPDDLPRPRDADLSSHDRVTLQLDVDRDYVTAYEFAVDHRGWTHDACWNDAAWNPTWYVAAAADDATWTIEVAIPLAELVSEPPAARQVWAVSLERTIPGGDGESWSGNAAAADSPDRFGLLIFE